MDDRYHRQDVEIILNREGEVYKEVVARAEAQGVPVEVMVDSLVSLFIERHIKENLRFHKMMEAKMRGKSNL